MSDIRTGDSNIPVNQQNQQMNPQAGDSQMNQQHHGSIFDKAKHFAAQKIHQELNQAVGRVGLPSVGGGMFGGLMNKAENAIVQGTKKYAQNQINERMGQGGNANAPMDNSQSATRPGQDVTAQQAPKDVQQAPVVQKDVHGTVQQPVADVPSTGGTKTQGMESKQQVNHKAATSLDTNTHDLYKTTTTAEVPKPGTTAQASAVHTDSSSSSVTDSSWLSAPHKSMSEIYAESERKRIRDINEKYKHKNQ